MTTAVLLKILTSKYTWMVLTILLTILCISLVVKLMGQQVESEKTKSLENRIENLLIEKSTLEKELVNEKTKIILQNSFSNSLNEIKKIEKRELNENEKNAFASVSNDYYNFMLSH